MQRLSQAPWRKRQCWPLLDPLTKGVIRSVLVASPKTQEQLKAAGKVDSARCPHCDREEDEDLPHLYWRCPRWGQQRKEGMGEEVVDCSAWEPITQHTGLIPEPPEEWAAESRCRRKTP